MVGWDKLVDTKLVAVAAELNWMRFLVVAVQTGALDDRPILKVYDVHLPEVEMVFVRVKSVSFFYIKIISILLIS